jgi:hypothetical protein
MASAEKSSTSAAGESRATAIVGSSLMALKSCVAVTLLLILSGLTACHGHRSWHDGAADQSASTPAASSPTGQNSHPSEDAGACTLNEEETYGLNGDLTSDVRAVRNYTATIAQVLQEEKFDDLDCLANHARSRKERFPGGDWKLHEIYKGLYEPVQYPQHVSEADWDVLFQKLQRWISSRPNSVTARVALAEAYIGYAYDARGQDAADTVSESGWRLFRERTTDAKRILDEASSLPAKCPEWYVAMLKVAQNQDWPEAARRALFDKAFKLEPDYYYTARVLAASLLSKWGGGLGATRQFMEEIADHVGGPQGDILYFQIASANELTCACKEDPNLSSERMERGFESAEKQYGVSLVNLNRIAFLAARTSPQDIVYADKALTRIGEQWDEETWTFKQDFDMAKASAARMGPQIRALEDTANANMNTAEGIRYRASFEKPYKELVQQCVEKKGSDVGKFKTFTRVGANGTAEEFGIYWNNDASRCMGEKLLAFRNTKATPFPAPPQAPYWVRLDLNWEDFADSKSK